MGAALDGGEADVPCGTCTSCCRSHQVVPVEPDEADTLAAIPPALLFDAPGEPGVLILPWDAEGRCPMLGERGCTVYEARPRACRVYDCRVFAATGVEPHDEPVRLRVREWRWDVVDDTDAEALSSLRAAADELRAEDPTSHPTRVAVVAVRRVSGAPG